MHTQTHAQACTSDWIVCVIQLSRQRVAGFDRDILVELYSLNRNKRFKLKQLCRALDCVHLNKDCYLLPLLALIAISKLCDTHYQRIRASAQPLHDGCALSIKLIVHQGNN